MPSLITDFTHEYRRHKSLADTAMGQLADADFFRRPAAHVNPVAVIVKHLAGNLASRWTDFLTTDGEKPTRDRDAEFVLTEQDSRANLLAAWETGWTRLMGTLSQLNDADLQKTVTIRGEPHSAYQALLRGLTHAAYHTGQILYVVRLFQPDGAWLTIPPGESKVHVAGYRKG